MQRGKEIAIELKAGDVERCQGDLRQLLDAKKIQQVVEGKGFDEDNNNGDNFLVVHQRSDANKLINTAVVTRNFNDIVLGENYVIAVVSAEADPTTIAGTQSFGSDRSSQ